MLTNIQGRTRWERRRIKTQKMQTTKWAYKPTWATL
jgi:hypothetical protein